MAPPVPVSTRPLAPPQAYRPPILPRNPGAKQISQPAVHLHPSYLFELRERLTKDSKTWCLLRTSLKKVIVDEAVHSVTFSKRYGPGGPHAFLSFAPHFHANQEQVAAYLAKHPGAPQQEWEDKVEWIRIDGNRTKDQGGATQGEEINALTSKVFLLGLGYHFALKFDPPNAEKYAAKAHQLLWVFFGDPQTAMLPEVLYGQYVRGSQPKAKYRPEGFLHIRSLILVSQVLPLLPSPPSTLSPHAFMHPWLAHHVEFLQKHELGKAAALRRNNIGTHYHTQLTTHLVALDRAHEAHAVIVGLFFPSPLHPRGLSAKIDSFGVPVHEVKRPTPYGYTAFELQLLTFLADLASDVRRYNGGAHLPDVWEAENEALKRCLGFGLQYFLRTVPGAPTAMPLPSSVPKEPEKGSEIRTMVFPTRSVAVRYGRAEYVWMVGHGGDGEMEPTKDAKWELIVPLTGWTVSARLRWALLEGY